MKSRPLGVTILAIWALVGSGVVSVYTISFAIYLQWLYHEDFLNIFSTAGDFIVVPLGLPALGGLADPTLGSFFTAINIISKISLGILYAFIGLFTFRGSKFAWLGNVSVSIAGVASAAMLFYYLILQEIKAPSPSGIGDSQFFMQTVALYSIYLAVAALRLFYLSKPNVREFFGIKSLFVKTQNA